MKSLLKADGITQKRIATAWKPAELEDHQNACIKIRRQEILALFGTADANRDLRKRAPLSSPLRPVDSQAQYDSWMLGEFEQSNSASIEEWPFRTQGITDQVHVSDIGKFGPNYEQEVENLLIQAREQADEIILQAQQSADETLLQTQEEIDRTIAEGYQQGWAKAREEAEAVIQTAHAILEQVTQWREQMLAETENTVIAMIKEISQVMFGDGIVLDNSALQVNYNRVVENAKALGDLKIYINTLDAAVLDHSWGDFQTLITGNKVQVIPSDEITRGGCFAQGQMGTVDARVETELKNVLEAIAAEQASAENMA